ncbi:HAMP domain-containing protein [bacterium]|nr:HAMP domain-containing protein [bacterium]
MVKEEDKLLQAKKASKKGIRIPLMIQFTFFVILTIVTIMAMTTWLTYRQQQKSLQDEVVKRGATIAGSLASSAGETVLDELNCAALVHEIMPETGSKEYNEIDLQATLDSLVHDVLGNHPKTYEELISNAGVVAAFIVNKDGMIIAHNDIKMFQKKYVPPKGVAPYNGQSILVQAYQAENGEKLFDIAVPVIVRKPLVGDKQIGVVHLGMSRKLVDLTVRQAAVKLGIASVFILCLGAMVAIILAQYLTRPVKILVGGVLAIAEGDLNQEIKVTRKDELGDLTSAFNEMAASLREKEVIKGAFSTYVSSQVMEEVIKDPGSLALGGARKNATMFFSDIRGFTSMSETMEPEDVVSVINVYLSVQTEILLRYGGMLDKFIGDCVMAVFGIPLAKKGDALRAVKSGLEIQHAVQELNQARKMAGEKTVTVGIGINTGDVVSGNMGSSQKMDYTVIGDAVNMAARLESVAEGGSVLISEATYLLVQDEIVADKLSPIAVKGKKEKILVYSVKSLKT